MENRYSSILAKQGYKTLVCDIFPKWEDVKDELLPKERKQGSGSGTVHVFLGAADDALQNEFSTYYSSVDSGKDPAENAVTIRHFFSINNILSMLGYVCQFCTDKHQDYAKDVNFALDYIRNHKSIDGFLQDTSLFKISTGASKLRPYFKQFDGQGVFYNVIRKLLLPNSAYKISLYKSQAGEYAATWLIGNSSLLDFDADIEQAKQSICEEIQLKNLDKYVKRLLEKKNLVFTGAPGTGKTYMAKQIASILVGNGSWESLTEEQREHVGFVQFHPSYDYTDFVEGLRPTKDGNFERQDGVFKAFCKRAITSKSFNLKDEWDKLLTDVDSGALTELVTKSGGLVEGLHVSDGRLKWTIEEREDNHALSFSNLKTAYEKYPTATPEKVSDVAQSGIDTQIWAVLNEIHRRKSLHTDSDKPFVFIIDEINRGELSKIFGELFYSIEPDYRGEKGRVQTQYNNMVEDGDVFKDGFYIPENVYIIGTMNDVDRGVEAMDFAIRRRFGWPIVTAEESAENMGITGLAHKKMTALNKALEEKGLTPAYHIGGAFFRKLRDNDYDSLWDYHLKGIISEYFRGDPDAEDKLNYIELVYKSVKDDESQIESPSAEEHTEEIPTDESES